MILESNEWMNERTEMNWMWAINNAKCMLRMSSKKNETAWKTMTALPLLSHCSCVSVCMWIEISRDACDRNGNQHVNLSKYISSIVIRLNSIANSLGKLIFYLSPCVCFIFTSINDLEMEDGWKGRDLIDSTTPRMYKNTVNEAKIME